MPNLLDIDAPAFLDLLPSTTADRLIADAVLMKYGDGQLIHTRGALKPGLSIVRSGAAQVGVNDIEGRFVMVSALGPGECFGEFTLFTQLPRTHDISSIGDSEVYQLSKTKFDRLYADEPSIAHALLKTTLTRTHILLEMLDAIRRLPILERTAKVILSMAYTLGGSNILKSRQEELAFALGITRVSLGKALRELSRLGLIEIGYGRIIIPNFEGLETWVERNCAGATI